MNEALESKIIDIIKSVMGIDVSKMDRSNKINTMPRWDSFNNLMLISRFQDEFNIEFTAVEIENTLTIQSIFDLIDSKLS